MTTTAEVVVLIAEDWLRRLARDGHPPPGEDVRAALATVALAAPSVAVRCPALLRAIGPQAAHAVYRQASASDATRLARAPAAGAGWVSAGWAARRLGMGAQGVRAACRSGKLRAVRHETGWRIDPQAVDEYAAARRKAA